jgi:23S rRNA (uracil1939-C5)-methyltransferase
LASKLKKYYGHVFTDLTVDAAGAEGNCIARFETLVIFIPYAAPGDIVDVKIVGFKKRFMIGEIVAIKKAATERIDPKCEHFGTCGGCKWQHLAYPAQLMWKQQVVKDAFTRLHKIEIPMLRPIMGSKEQFEYRNKLEYSFSETRWIMPDEPEGASKLAAGFHIPGRFDKILDINACHLQEDLSNQFRNFVKDKAIEMGLTFYHPRNHTGYMRNMIVRNTTNGDWMIILIVGEDDATSAIEILDALTQKFSEIKSCFYILNTKNNDTIYDLPLHLHKGEEYLVETLHDLKFKIRPKSFFQPNGKQAHALYQVALDMAHLSGNEIVYDLYCGTGTISLFLAQNAKKVVGIESVPQAIEDANENAALNGITNAHFEVGDMRYLFNDALINKYGKPDVVVTDPPRIGMHDDVINQLLALEPEKIVYVSCNPGTQARDVQLLLSKYDLADVQPVDMFPHTHHVENVVLLIRK